MEYRQSFDRMIVDRARSKFQIRQQWQDLMASEASATQVARAFAVGTFIGLVPLPGLDIVLTAVVLRSFRQLERLPLFAAMTVWNNVVAAPLYAAGYRLGAVCLALAPLAIEEKVPHAAVWPLRFMIGNLIVASVTAVASYLAVQQGFGRYKSRKM